MYNLRELIKIEGFNINLYGILFVIAFITLFFLIKRYLKSEKKDEDLAFSAVIYLLLGTLIGARILYVFYYSFSYFIANPIEILYFWKGGLSFHGGVLGMIIGGFLFCKKNKIDFLELADLIAIPAAFFLALGKLINFFNSELYGTITNVPWCVKFPTAEGCRHPVQVYESVKNFFVFFFLVYLRKSKVKKGLISLTFIFLYSFLRFFIDFFREYDTIYFGLGSGQYLNILTFLISGYFLYKLRRT